jgi:hypothetical protein
MMDTRKILRQEISKGTISRYRIAQETGVSEAQLCRFMQGGSLKVETTDILLDYFGYELKKKARRT